MSYTCLYWKLSILWSPLKIWMPQKFATANFWHPVSKSWLRPWTVSLKFILQISIFEGTSTILYLTKDILITSDSTRDNTDDDETPVSSDGEEMSCSEKEDGEYEDMGARVLRRRGQSESSRNESSPHPNVSLDVLAQVATATLEGSDSLDTEPSTTSPPPQKKVIFCKRMYNTLCI